VSSRSTNIGCQRKTGTLLLELLTVILESCSYEGRHAAEELRANQPDLTVKKSLFCGLGWPQARVRKNYNTVQ